MKKRCVFNIFLLILLVISLSSFAYAHGEEINEEDHEEGIHEEGVDLDKYFRSTSLTYTIVGFILVILITLFSLFHKKKTEKLKWFLFSVITILTVLITVYVAGTTIYLNTISETKGPVHWHADFEIWNCGEEVDLINPKGLSNRVGTSVFHEHGDNRIHVEGVVLDESDVDLHNFFNSIGGSLTKNSLSISTDQGIVNLADRDLCNNEDGKLQVFVYRIVNPEDNKNWVFEQIKLDNFEDYVLSSYATIPPGDCIIVEFDKDKNQTDKMCNTYKISIQKGDLSGS